MSEIVVGVDGSAASRSALRWALERSARTGDQVTGVHVWSLPLEVDVPLGLDATEALREDLGGAAAGSCAHTSLIALTGDPGAALVDLARTADLLVVGARHHLSVHPRGPVSSYCIHHSRTPIAVVPGDLAWRSADRPSRVVVAVDLSPESAAALRWAGREAHTREAELTVAHAWQHSPASKTDLAHRADTRLAPEARAARELQDWVGDVLGSAPPTLMHLYAEHGGPLDTVRKHASGADLVVLGSHGHSPLARLLRGSLSNQLTMLCSCPIVVVPLAGSLTAPTS